MRLAGRIRDWNDDRGYGFVVPSGGGDRSFVHIKAFQPGSRRPADGDLVSYVATRDARGRSNASEVRFAGQRIAPRTPARPAKRGRRPSRLPRGLLGGASLLAVAAGTASGAIPLVPALGWALVSVVSYLAYWLDKEAAQRRARRIPESTLHLMDLLGGWPGALIAQQQFRHKTAKRPFQVAFWCSVVANLALAAWLLRSGAARWLTDALLGVGA